MPDSDRTVLCPICDDDFDPTVAGGWCTNPDCGEWQYTAETDTPAATESDADDGSEGDASTADETPDVDPSVTSETPIRKPAESNGQAPASSEAVASAGESAANGDDDTVGRETRAITGESESEAEAATIRCPDCDTELGADANFCVECGTDVRNVTPGDGSVLTACPSCETAIGEDDSFCVNCGEDLDAHRDGTATDAAVSDAPADASGTDTAAERTAHSTPERLVLSVVGRDIAVADGDRIGREVRAALLDAGRPEDEAVRIHREHVRFDRQPDGFYLVDLGDNPTRLNGNPLKKGDRERIQQGDELELSGVVTMTIEAA